jgi:hypothetical protein
MLVAGEGESGAAPPAVADRKETREGQTRATEVSGRRRDWRGGERETGVANKQKSAWRRR